MNSRSARSLCLTTGTSSMLSGLACSRPSPSSSKQGNRVSSIISRRRHPAAGYAAVAGGLVAAGVLYSAFSGGGASAAAPAQDSTQIAQGHSLFIQSCATCHGLDAQGTSQAPSLIGAGAAAVDFQMSTGRMAAQQLGAENDRKPTTFTQQQIYDIAAYVASLGGGPSIPDPGQVSTAGANTRS